MAQGQVVQKASFTRRFVSTMKGSWKVSVNVPGFSAKPSTSSLDTSRKNDVEDLTVTFTRTDAPIGQFTQGFVTLTGPTTVRLPVALRPVAVAAPAEVEGSGTTGEAEVEITPGFTGELEINEAGLAEADTTEGTVEGTDTGFFDDYCVTVSETGKALRANLDALPTGSGDYLDLYAYVLDGDCATGDIVDYAAVAATGSGDESFTLAEPEAGSYIISVEMFEPPAGENSVDYVLDIFNVDATTTLGDFHAEPNPVPVIAGQPTSFDAVWSGLDEDRRYLGVLQYEGALGPTYVTVDTAGNPAP
jgi:hypothetical protein